MIDKEYVLVTDWEKADKDDFYLTKEYIKDEDIEKQVNELLKDGKLFEAYIAPAVGYVIYYQLDAEKVFIDSGSNVIVFGENAVIGNNHKHREEYQY